MGSPRRPARLFAAALLGAAACAARSDVAVVFPTHPARYDVVRAGGETWRAGAPAVIVTEGPSEGPTAPPYENVTVEHWFTFPDDLRPDMGIWKKGDMKAAASFRIANETLGAAYDWLLHGDDDTVFVLDNVYALLDRLRLDPSVPYILSDSVSFCADARCKEAKTCGVAGPAGAPPYSPPGSGGCTTRPVAAPCTRDAVNAPGTCDVPAAWYGLSFPCGRNGALVSRGALNLLSGAQWREECELPNELRGGGELRVYNCLWKRNLTMTDPTLGDASFCAFGFLKPDQLLATAKDVVAAGGACDAACLRILFETVAVTMDLVGVTPELARDLHASVARAKILVWEARLQADARELRAAMRREGHLAAPFLATELSSSGGGPRWELFRRFVRAAAKAGVPAWVFAADEAALRRCREATPLCFRPAETLAVSEPAAAAARLLFMALAASAGREFAFSGHGAVFGAGRRRVARRQGLVSSGGRVRTGFAFRLISPFAERKRVR